MKSTSIKITANKFSTPVKLWALLLTVLVLGGSFKIKETDFSGTWTRNTEKCYVSEGLSINSIPTAMVIDQTATEIDITRTQKKGSGEITTYTESLGGGGSNSTYKGVTLQETIKGNLIRKSNITLSADRSAITETSEIDAPRNTKQRTTETWSLLDDGSKTLQVKALVKLDGELYNWIGIFERSRK